MLGNQEDGTYQQLPPRVAGRMKGILQKAPWGNWWKNLVSVPKKKKEHAGVTDDFRRMRQMNCRIWLWFPEDSAVELPPRCSFSGLCWSSGTAYSEYLRDSCCATWLRRRRRTLSAWFNLSLPVLLIWKQNTFHRYVERVQWITTHKIHRTEPGTSKSSTNFSYFKNFENICSKQFQVHI